MVTSSAVRDALRQVELRAAAGGDERQLRHDVLEIVSAVVPYDAYAWVLTDPQTCVGTSPLAQTPSLADLPRLVRLKYLTDVNRWTTVSDPAVVTLHRTTSGDLSRSLVWRELLHTYGVSDVASCVHRDRHGCWAFLDLWRTGGATFDDGEVDLLVAATDLTTAALRRGIAGTMTAPSSNDLPPGPVVLLLSDALDVHAQTPLTSGYLRAFVPAAPDAEPVPAVAYNVAAQLLAREAGADDHPAWARATLPGDRLVSVRADRLQTSADGAATIAVTVEPASAAERADLFVRAFGLSPRESELVVALAGGGDTREVARSLEVSQNTVQDHLKAVFAKTSAHSRAQLLAWVRGA